MEVILLKTIKNNQKEGDIINVANGYAKNYLIPKGLAVLATKQKILELESQKKSERIRKLKEEEHAKELAKQLMSLNVKLEAKTGENGKLFGSITSADISEALKNQYEIEINKKDFKLPENGIKSIGTFNVEIKLFPTVTAELTVIITEET